MKTYLYYESKFSDRVSVQRATYGEDMLNEQYKTKESAMEYISSFSAFSRWATKQEWEQYCFDNAMRRMKPAIESDNIKEIFSWLCSNDNTFSMRCFTILTGVELSKTWKVRKQQLISYFGDKYTKYLQEIEEKQQKEEQEAKEQEAKELAELEHHFIDGEYITGTEFIKLCDKNNVKIAIRSRGYCLDKVVHVNIEGRYKTKGNISKGFTKAFWELKGVLTK